jgi:hypothetical protein
MPFSIISYKIKPPAGDEAAGGKGVKTRMESL